MGHHRGHTQGNDPGSAAEGDLGISGGGQESMGIVPFDYMEGGMSSRVGRRGHSPTFRASVVAAIVSGSKVRDVATLYGVSKASIWLWCKEGGLKPKNIVLPPTCHPDRPHYGRGFCRKCYRRESYYNGNVHGPSRRAA